MIFIYIERWYGKRRYDIFPEKQDSYINVRELDQLMRTLVRINDSERFLVLVIDELKFSDYS